MYITPIVIFSDDTLSLSYLTVTSHYYFRKMLIFAKNLARFHRMSFSHQTSFQSLSCLSMWGLFFKTFFILHSYKMKIFPPLMDRECFWLEQVFGFVFLFLILTGKIHVFINNLILFFFGSCNSEMSKNLPCLKTQLLKDAYSS